MNINDVLDLPELKKGDIIGIGRFKNKKAIINDIIIDDDNQPYVITSKGKKRLFNFKLFDNEKE